MEVAFGSRKMQKLCDSAKEMRAKLGERWQETGFVFTSTIGTPSDERRVRNELAGIITAINAQIVCEAAEQGRKVLRDELVPLVTFHGLRHSAGSILLAQGMDIYAAKELLRHSQIALTANLYAHSTTKLRQDTANAMDRAFSTG